MTASRQTSRKSSKGRGRPRVFPTQWLLTDERLGGERPDDPLWQAVRNLPRGGGVIFRHYGWQPQQRAALLARLEAICLRRGLLMLVSGASRSRGGVHRPGQSRARTAQGLTTASAHNRREMLEAFARGADLVFLSPLFPTRSHPGKPALGAARFGLIAQAAPGPVLALGGVSQRDLPRLKALGAAGFGAIDGWVPGRRSG